MKTRFTQLPVLITLVALVGIVAVVLGIAMAGGEGSVHDTHIAILVSVVTPIIATLLILIRQGEIISKVDNLQNGLMDEKIKDNVHKVLDERGAPPRQTPPQEE